MFRVLLIGDVIVHQESVIEVQVMLIKAKALLMIQYCFVGYWFVFLVQNLIMQQNLSLVCNYCKVQSVKQKQFLNNFCTLFSLLLFWFQRIYCEEQDILLPPWNKYQDFFCCWQPLLRLSVKYLAFHISFVGL